MSEDATATRAALSEAVDDEYKARATYRAIIDRFGAVRPFVNVIQSEQRHIDALLRLFAARDWAPPPDRWAGRVPAPDSVEDACRQGIAAEIENAALYERLFAMTSDPEVLAVFAALREASAERHLPAFRRALGGQGRRGGSGPGQANRHLIPG